MSSSSPKVQRPRGRLDIRHVEYPVADLDQSIAFYCRGLGFTLAGQDEESAFVSLCQGGFTLELIARAAAETATSSRALDDVAFNAPDLDAYRETLIEYHATYYGAFALDPEGRNIEAVCRAPE